MASRINCDYEGDAVDAAFAPPPPLCRCALLAAGGCSLPGPAVRRQPLKMFYPSNPAIISKPMTDVHQVHCKVSCDSQLICTCRHTASLA